MSRQQKNIRFGRHQSSSHQHIEQLLSNYRYLTLAEQAQVQEHLRTCAACRRQLAAFQQMDQLLQQNEQQNPQTPIERWLLRGC